MHLNRNDNYVAVFDQNDTGSVTLDSTTSGGQDPTGLTGWSIKDKFDWNNGGTWQQKSGGDEAFSITVKGYETPANQDATGRPIILASAGGAPILFADTSDIADENGRPYTGSSGSVIEFVYSYQWIRVDGDTSTETNIGVDSPSYLLVDADIGNLIKVQVSFTDRATYSETVTSLPFRPVARLAGPSQTPSTLVSNTGQSASATANITQQYAMEFTLGSYGQGYELSSVSIELAAVPPSLTVSLWIGDHSSQSSSPYTKLFDFENPSPFVVGMNKFTAPAGVLAYPSVHYYIVLSDFGSSLSINGTTSDAEDAGGETGATLADNAGGDSNVLRLWPSRDRGGARGHPGFDLRARRGGLNRPRNHLAWRRLLFPHGCRSSGSLPHPRFFLEIGRHNIKGRRHSQPVAPARRHEFLGRQAVQADQYT